MLGGLAGFVTKKTKKHDDDHEVMGGNLAKWAECLLWRDETARASIAVGQYVQIDWKPAPTDRLQKYFPKGGISCAVYEGERPSIWGIDFEPPASLKKLDDVEDVGDLVATLFGADAPTDGTGAAGEGEGEESTEDPPLRTGQEEADDSLATLQV